MVIKIVRLATTCRLHELYKNHEVASHQRHHAAAITCIVWGTICLNALWCVCLTHILFVAGLSFVIGLERTFKFFFQRHKFKATSFFLGGVLVVLIGWPIIGVVLEIYGFFLLFRGFFPVAVGFIRRLPVLGSILNLPVISGFVDKVGESNNMV
ncbi:vesicle transport protein GOT1B isoform X1 [Oncorhynchus mykiss]|uniref:vesicle transport protein GOT1B isoform X1 n=1 Tax=Oncorhynchus mykiss TaxID=8022 RepID=UPI0018776FD6|nr:vesicle transport protein GOT1B isoform X1 [Oncorhynchus mykiss]